MTIANFWWALSGVLVLLIVRQLRTLHRNRQGSIRTDQDQWLERAVQSLADRPDAPSLVNALGRCAPDGLAQVRRIADFPSTTARLTAEIASSLSRHAVLPTVEKAVNSWNAVGELIDDGLVRSKELFGRNDQLHRDALIELTFLEPMIWHESLVAGRGRWGYRVLQLSELARQLRCNTFSSAVLDEVRSPLPFGELVVAPRLGWGKQLLGRLSNAVHRRTITAKTKMRQEKRAVTMRRELMRRGVRLAEMREVHHQW